MLMNGCKECGEEADDVESLQLRTKRMMPPLVEMRCRTGLGEDGFSLRLPKEWVKGWTGP